MNCLIIEDEKAAAKRLEKLIADYDSGIEVLAVVQSVRKAVEWFQNNGSPDLVFVDIQLADGLSFEIFEQCQVESPLIFTTAYDEYALKAFKVNSIDYLLKPIDFSELSKAIDKFKDKHQKEQLPNHVFDSVLKALTNNFKSKFVIKVGEHIKVVQVGQVQCFYSAEKATFLQNNQGRDYALNYSLDQLVELLDPQKFFRISRKYIVAFDAIQDILSYSNSRLQIRLKSETPDEIIVSRERVNDFKIWLES